MWEGFSECSCSFFEMIVWNLDEEMVDLMSADIVRQVVCPAVMTVNRTQVSTDKVPLAVGVPGNLYILVMEKSDNHKP